MIQEPINLINELADAERQSAESLNVLRQHGFVVDMADWLTIKHYAQKYGLSQQVVVNWLNRGIVPADCLMVLREFNDIRLIKDQPYR